MTNKKDRSDLKNNSDSESVELFDDIFGEEIDGSTARLSRKRPSLDHRIKDIVTRFCAYLKRGLRQETSDVEMSDLTCRLNVVGGPMKGHSFKIKEKVTFIGRSQENDIEITDKTISRRHIKITKKNNKFFIEDLGSHNGLMVDGIRVRSFKEIELMDGKVYSIGDSEFSIEKVHPE